MNGVNAHSPCVVFRAEASSYFGMGHLMRCEALVESLPYVISPALVLKDSPEYSIIADRLIKKGWKLHVLDAALREEADVFELVSYARTVQAKLIVTDLYHRESMGDTRYLLRYHQQIKKTSDFFIVSFEDCRLHQFASDVAVIPNQVHDKDVCSKVDACRVLAGLKYFIFSPRIQRAAREKRHIAEKACRLLICMGGADPYALSSKLLEALSEMGLQNLSVKLILSALISQIELKKIEAFAASFPNFELVKFTDKLEQLLMWSDLAILGEGNIKFDAAVTGTPALILSQFDHASKPLKDFYALGCAEYIGEGGSLDKYVLREAICRLLKSKKKRLTMSHLGKIVLDGKGAIRLYHEVFREFLG